MNMEVHSKIISINARKGFFIPKNRNDHNIFRTNCIENIVIGIDISFPEVTIRYKEIPIKRYKIVQTGPNILLGGLNLDFFIFEYHFGMDFILNNEPNIPAN